MAQGSRGGAGKSLVRATLAIHEPPTGDSTAPGGLIRTFDFDFNPAQLSLSRRALWKSTVAQIERDGPLPEFMGSEPREMNLEIFLDSSGDPTSTAVLKKVEALLKCCQVTERSIAAKQPSPPWVVFQWGSFSTARFTAYVSSVEAGYTLFGTTGVPIRATCRLQLHEIPSRTEGQNPTSGALTARRVHRVVAGDSLQSLAWREYGSAAAWRAIAEANGIDDPSRLPSGTELVLPAAEEVRV
ncbi:MULTISPECIES: LysM peptidoglycan-binding domain-containing protein [Streptomyces]|uniref:LysM peptidoglycan-binding domain-containing protein n=1 Tax=Streptomyces thermoviolaceus subsp. thermoviolaceus TaxID=66860 RepID=A0ABX0YP57_STRTL|nr:MULTISPECIES: LysM peptidoglycan-binding domain-containing protein [Streptomyces]MCM3264504.1 LysM peptidoglycan-binding domain-containing protein [Streptomyces thermoviolaceus]NJP14278.1 LysM peptidoglycan-binding domain-containing protein [Streptomyces thermoviolaceus subsp. thermoviolaceus]RSR97959.1 LysM peptidoglycan-binding domain-containing protein [Streptomyces sp. WAC00469]WTD47208.1 LysM peptidoglycan-binding domain-containing protein [Streptomyces thermoviolaceus]GGV79322.1 pepti